MLNDGMDEEEFDHLFRSISMAKATLHRLQVVIKQAETQTIREAILGEKRRVEQHLTELTGALSALRLKAATRTKR